MSRPNLLRVRYTLLKVSDIGTSSHSQMWSSMIGSRFSVIQVLDCQMPGKFGETIPGGKDNLVSWMPWF